MSVYDLTPERVGEFDLVVCGSLLLHLRDPLRALAAMASVCRGQLLSAEQISARLSLLHRREPLVRVSPGPVHLVQWWEPNAAGHRRMIQAAGFQILEAPRPYSIPFGQGHRATPGGLAVMRERMVRRIVTGGDGVPHSAVLAAAAAG
jgi:tRNA (mo5U34)-methyltransferase